MLMIGLAGTELLAQERDWLRHDGCAGVVLFARNVASRAQLGELCAAIRAASPRPLLLAVDQEGGCVQRLRDGYTQLPALHSFDSLHRRDPEAALALAREHAWIMASEVRATGIDLSFAPVVDLARGNRAIGSRAFSPEPQVVAAFADAYVRGMRDADMAATLKHFPGHGSVIEDTHYVRAEDPRTLAMLREEDLVPFIAGIAAGADAVMMAHVVYPQIAPQPAGCSRVWIEDVLRGELGFRGVVFSDDIGMAAAAAAGGIAARIHAHLDAGCDVVLASKPEIVEQALAAMSGRRSNTRALIGLIGRGPMGWDGLLADARYRDAQTRLRALRWSGVEGDAVSGAVVSGNLA